MKIIDGRHLWRRRWRQSGLARNIACNILLWNEGIPLGHGCTRGSLPQRHWRISPGAGGGAGSPVRLALVRTFDAEI
jgi:hypothetical protein